MCWPVRSDPPIWPSNLERTMYSHSPPVLSRMMRKKVLNPTPYPMKVTCFREALGEIHDCAYPHSHKSTFQKSLHQMRGQMSAIHSIHHTPPRYQSHFLLQGIMFAFARFSFLSYIVRCWCEFICRIVNCCNFLIIFHAPRMAFLFQFISYLTYRAKPHLLRFLLYLRHYFIYELSRSQHEW